LAIYKDSKSDTQPAADMQLQLLQQNVQPYEDQQLKDVYAVTFSPIVSTSPPLAIFSAVSAGGSAYDVSDLLEKDLAAGSILGSARECPASENITSFRYIHTYYKDCSRSTCKFQTYLADLYKVRSKLGPSSTPGYALPECLEDLIPEDATVVGTSQAMCWFQALGEVKIHMR
jgi:hypothetical protein